MKTFVNPQPTSMIYYWATVRFAPWELNHEMGNYGGLASAQVFEMRADSGFSVIGLPAVYSTDAYYNSPDVYDAHFVWALCSYDMTPGNHALGTQNVTAVPAEHSTDYFVVLGYYHTATNAQLTLWVDNKLIATVNDAYTFNFAANNIYAGGVKSLWGNLQSSTFLDDLGVGYEYPQQVIPEGDGFFPDNPASNPTDNATAQETQGEMTTEEWSMFWSWLKTQQKSTHWAGYLDDMLDKWKSEFT